MRVSTTRFGDLDVAQDRVIQFPLGVLGFPQFKRWILLQASPDSAFFWLQSAEAPDLAFILTQPDMFFADYQVRAQPEELAVIALENLRDGEVFVICNRDGDSVTVNLQGPLIFNAAARQARQVVLCDRHLTPRHPVCTIGGREVLASRAV